MYLKIKSATVKLLVQCYFQTPDFHSCFRCTYMPGSGTWIKGLGLKESFLSFFTHLYNLILLSLYLLFTKDKLEFLTEH